MAKYVVAALILALAWALCIYLELHWAIPVFVSVLVIACLAGWVVFQWLRAKRAARELERGLAAQALDQSKNARPDLQAEIEQMQGEFAKAVTALRSSKLGRSGVDALYALPWYVIVGPPGSGKTTALRESGLEFPMTSSRGSLRGIGGTRNCDWWLTNQGVLLDTAGRWTDEEDKEEWFGFLDLVKKTRPRKPLNGILVAVSVADLGNAHDGDVQAVGRRVRERIDEILGRLQMRLPVYVLFTKCDLVPGFVESFRDLGTQERAQIWGSTIPLETSTSDPGGLFRDRFDELQRTLQQFTLRRMGEVQKIEDREQIFGFPQQLQVLRENLAQFVATAFKDNIYQETPVLRGVYFTSGTQEGRPIDRVMRRMAEAFGLRSDPGLPPPSVEARSYFLRDVFSGVVFQDADLAGRSVAEQRRQARVRTIAAASIFGFAVLVSSLPTWAWWNNRDLVQSTAEVVAAVEAARAQANETAPMPLSALEPLRERAELLRSYQDEGAPVSMRFGMYEGDTLAPGVLELYASTLREEVLQPLVASDVDRLEDFGRRYEALADVRPSGAEHAEMYEVLKAYLLLTQPAEDSQPPMDPALQQWLAGEIVERWAARAAGPDGAPVAAPELARMGSHAQFFVSLLAREPALAFPRDAAMVQRTRVALTRVPQANLILERLIQELEPSGYGLTLRSLIGTSVTAMNARSAVRAAFTRRAWESRVRDMLAAPPSSLTGEGWVLGPEAARAAGDEAARQAELEQVASEYFRQYIEEWQEFVRGVRVTAPDGEVRSLTTLQDLTRGEPPPLGRLLRQVHYNLQLLYPEPPATEDPGVLAAVVAEGTEAVQRRTPRQARRVVGAVGEALARGADGQPVSQNLVAEDVARSFEGLTSFAVPAVQPAEGQPAQTTSLDVYQEQLEFVRDAMQTQLENPDERDALVARLQTARVRVRALIEEQEVGWRPRFEALLWPPIDGASLGSTRAAAVGAARGWCSDVVQPYSRNIEGRFPFVPAGHDASLVDFTEFFKRDGAVWTYYDESLDDAIEQRGDSFAFTTRLGRDASVVYARALPGFLQSARDVTESFFPPGSETPRVDFDVQILPAPDVATISFSVGGTEVQYENGPERWTRVSWPGEHPEAGAVLELRGANGMHERLEQEGEWGLFHLLEAGTVTSADQRVFTVQFHVRTHDLDASISLRPVRGDNPFFGIVGREARPRFMQPVRTPTIEVPREIAAGQTLCRR